MSSHVLWQMYLQTAKNKILLVIKTWENLWIIITQLPSICFSLFIWIGYSTEGYMKCWVSCLPTARRNYRRFSTTFAGINYNIIDIPLQQDACLITAWWHKWHGRGFRNCLVRKTWHCGSNSVCKTKHMHIIVFILIKIILVNNYILF